MLENRPWEELNAITQAITAAPTKRPRTDKVRHPSVVTVTVGSACVATATELYLRKGQTWPFLIWPQRLQRYFLVSLAASLDLEDRRGAGDTLATASGSTKSSSADLGGRRRRPVDRAARAGAGNRGGIGGGGIGGTARSSSSRSKESRRNSPLNIRGCVASSYSSAEAPRLKGAGTGAVCTSFFTN